MKRFRYFFVIYLFLLLVGTRFFYVFSGEDLENFIYDLSGESQNLEANTNLDLELDFNVEENIINSPTLLQSQYSNLTGDLIQSGHTIQLTGENINSDQIIEIKSNQNLEPNQTFNILQDIPDLIISEVFYDGTDEWIEITNIGSDIFSGNIVISGAKSSLINIPNFIIYPNQSLILGDNCSILSNFSCIWSSGLAMSISDTNSINIAIIFSGQTINSFFVDQNIVNSYNNLNTSIEKIRLNGILELTGTSIDRSYNIISGYIANPGIMHIFNTTGSTGTGMSTGISNLVNLSITEVFFDGTDEWIEITNFGTGDFGGSLKIQGASSSIFEINNIFLQKDRSIIVADTNNQFQDFSNVINHSLSIPDTSQISINIIYSGQILDSFFVPQNFVNDINNYKISFERVLNGGNLVTTITNTGRIYNLKSEYISGGYVANPGKVRELTGNISDISSTGNGINIDLSGLIIPINCNDFSNNPFQITEIFSGDSQTSTYIELLGLDSFSGLIIFSGQGLSNNFTTNLNISEGERILITDGLQGILDEQENIVNTSLELVNSGGWLGVYGQDGQVLDIIYFVNTSSGKSIYFDGLYSYCARIFSKYDNYSPGFNQTLLSYFPQGVTVYQDKIIYIAGGGGGSCPVCSGNTNLNNSSGSYINFYTGNNSGQIRIVSIDYDPEGSDADREYVTLQSLISQDIELDSYRLQVVGKDSKKTIRGDILHSYASETFIGNYQFPNTASCVNLLYENIIIDTYCYGDDGSFLINTNTGLNGTEIFSGTQDFTGDFQIEIISINYDPEGSDANNESITLKLTGPSTINLSSFKLRINKDNKTTKKSIQGILQPGLSQTLIGNYSFPNSTNDGNSVIVSLVYNETSILDTYSYNPNIPQDLPSAGTYTVYSVTDGDTFKIKNGDKTFSMRLLGVDAPESSKTRYGYIECFGSQAKNYLKKFIDKKNIMIQYDDSQIVDSYGRALVYVFLDGKNINEKMIEDGYAREYTHQDKVYQYQSTFRSAQSFAQENSFGLWAKSSCSGLRLAVGSGNLDLINTGVYSTGNSNIKIVSILPNPQGNDKGKESITLIYNIPSSDNFQNPNEFEASNSLNLGDGYYLLIGTRKRYLTGILIAGEEKTLIGNYSFPNKASCISIAKDKIVLDTFCYDKADNGELFQINNGAISSISSLDLSILNGSKLQKFGSNLCLTYQGQVFHCKKMPSSKTSIKNQNKIKLYENYLELIDDYLRQNWQVLFYNTDIKNYFSLLNEAKKNISKGVYYININGETIQTTDIIKRYDLKYNQTSYDFLINHFKNDLIGLDIVDKYKKLKEEYFEVLRNN